MQTERVEGKGAATGTTLHAAITIVSTALFVLFSLCGATALAGLSEDDQQCLACHSSRGLSKKLRNGEKLQLNVAGPAFAESVHNAIGCAGCHADIDLKSHPRSKRRIPGTREYSVAQIEVCRQCHEDQFKQYEGSIHAALLRDGNPIAPVCTDCHSPHSVRPKADRASIGEVPCRQCHDAVFNAYAGSVHGLARSKPGNTSAPLCADCHRAHDVKAATTGDRLKNACLGCHQNTLAAHQAWLPNTERHLQAISCPACHVPAAQRRVDLRLYDSVTEERSSEKLGVPQFESRARSADAKGKGLDAMALQSLLREFNQDGSDSKTTLHGRLELRNGIEAHQLSAKSMAIKACDSCHRQGAAPFQSVTVSIVGPDGRPLRYGAQNEVLNSATSVESVGGFYAIGGTRIKLLDVLLVLALLSGVGVPLGHLTLKWLFRKYRIAHDSGHASGNAPIEGGLVAGDHPAAGKTPQQKE
jgi:hypothetical protein